MNPIATRMLSGQLASPQFRRAEEVVAWFGAMQAQEYQMMRWAVVMRTKQPGRCGLREAYDDGRILRMHLWRCTWQLVEAEYVRSWLMLCRGRGLSTCRGWAKAMGFTDTEAKYPQAEAVLVRALEGGRYLTSGQATDLLCRGGIVADRREASYVLHLGEIHGLLTSGPFCGRERTYALLDERLSRWCDARQVASCEPLPREEALALLARKYFRSHAPATMADFVWWTGLSAKDCRQAIASIEAELRTARILGDTYYIHDASRTRGFRSGQVTLLPSYDEYLIAYKSRHISLAPEHSHHAHNAFGVFYPVILVGGRVAGTWQPSRQGLAPRFFSSEPSPDVLSREVARYRSAIR